MENEINPANNVTSVINDNPNYFLESNTPGNNEINIFKEQFKKLSAELEKKNIKNIYIAVIPGGEIISQKLNNFIKNNGGRTSEFGEISDSYLIIKKLTEENGYEFIETFDEFSKNGDKYYFDNDLHWNEQGHKLMSEILSENIRLNK